MLSAATDETQAGIVQEVSIAAQVTKVRGFNSSGLSDFVFQSDDGYVAGWFMRNSSLDTALLFDPKNVGDSNWRIFAAGDYGLDGASDLVFQHQSGDVAVWHLNGTQLIKAELLQPSNPGEGWLAKAAGDFNGDRKADVLFQNNDGTLVVWLMEGIELGTPKLLNPDHPGDPQWRVVGTGHFDADGDTDIVFQHDDGRLAVWFMNEEVLRQGTLITPSHPGDSDWRVRSCSDLDQDGLTDLLFQHRRTGQLAVWFMTSATMREAKLITPDQPGGTWKLVAAFSPTEPGDRDGDGIPNDEDPYPDVPNVRPSVDALIVTSPENLHSPSVVTITVAAKDPDGPRPLTYSSAVNGIVINSGQSSPSMTWIPSSSQIGPQRVSITVSDGYLPATASKDIYVFRTPPKPN